METEHSQLKREGYLVIKVINDKDLKLGLAQVLFDKARGLYSSIKIVPSDVAIRGEEFKPEGESHLVYARYNPSHINIRQMIRECQKGQVANMLHLKNDEETYFILNKDYQEKILSLSEKAGLK